MLTYSIVLAQVISIIVVAFILRYAKPFKWKQSWVVSFGMIFITFIMLKTSADMNVEFTLLEWFVISFINGLGWNMCFYCKEEKSLIGAGIMILTPAIVLGSMF